MLRPKPKKISDPFELYFCVCMDSGDKTCERGGGRPANRMAILPSICPYVGLFNFYSWRSKGKTSMADVASMIYAFRGA